MKQQIKIKGKRFVLFLILILFYCKTFSFDRDSDTTPVSTRDEALAIINSISNLSPSSYWSNIKPELFLENIKRNITEPLSIYEGSYINFCGYASLSYIPLHFDPAGYVKFMLELYAKGKAHYGKEFFRPSLEVKKAAGTLTFKGVLDINHADQMWFLSLADHFKGYLNLLHPKYHPGDERTFWAAVNFSKFNRMIRTMFNYNVNASGYDLMRPDISDIYSYLKEQLKSGITFLYVDNYILTRKKHHFLRPAFPTHFLVLLDIDCEDGMINMTYWDYGFRTFTQITPSFLKKIFFGVSHCTKK